MTAVGNGQDTRSPGRAATGSLRWWLRTLLLGVILGLVLYIGRLALGMLP